MTTWNGPTPYELNGHKKWIDDEGRNGCRIDGYRAAMNSPEVRAMYEWLRLYINFMDGGDDVPDMFQAMGVLAAYEAGLKEQP